MFVLIVCYRNNWILWKCRNQPNFRRAYIHFQSMWGNLYKAKCKSGRESYSFHRTSKRSVRYFLVSNYGTESRTFYSKTCTKVWNSMHHYNCKFHYKTVNTFKVLWFVRTSVGVRTYVTLHVETDLEIFNFRLFYNRLISEEWIVRVQL